MTRPAGRLAAVFAMVLALLGPTPDTAARSDAGVDDAVARGRDAYARCAGCHSLDRNRAGPRHCGVVGRRAGAVPGFGYSPAMLRSNIVWTPETLDAFLAGPTGYVPGTSMGYAGVKGPRVRRDIIAWLAWASENSNRCRAEQEESRVKAADAGEQRR